MKVVIQPLGIAYLAAVIRGEVKVEILDAVAESNYERDLGDGFSWMGASAKSAVRLKKSTRKS